MELIKNKQEINNERIIKANFKKILKEFDIQLELQDALPVFINNFKNLGSFKNLIEHDLINSKFLNETLINASDVFEKTTFSTILIKSLNNLNIEGQIFKCSSGLITNSRINGKSEVIRMDSHSIEYKIKEQLLNESYVLEEINNITNYITNYIQDYIGNYKYIILYNVNIILSYNENMMPVIHLELLMNRHSKLQNINSKLDANNYSNIHEESEDIDFEDEFNSRLGEVKINDNTSIPYKKEYWLGTTEGFPKVETINEEDAPNEVLYDVASKYKELTDYKYTGEYQFGKVGRRRGRIQYKEKPSLIHRILLKLLLGVKWINYKK